MYPSSSSSTYLHTIPSHPKILIFRWKHKKSKSVFSNWHVHSSVPSAQQNKQQEQTTSLVQSEKNTGNVSAYTLHISSGTTPIKLFLSNRIMSIHGRREEKRFEMERLIS